MRLDDLSRHGVEAKRQIGRQTDENVLSYIVKSPGVTLYEIGKSLEFSIGKIQGSIKRLSKADKVVLKDAIQNGRRVTRIYSKDHVADSNITFTIKLVDDKTKWREKVHVYAVSRSNIIISPDENTKWKKSSVISESCLPVTRNNEIEVKLSKKMRDFYGLANSELDIAGIKNSIFVTVLSTAEVMYR